MWDFFDQILYINLDDRSDRRTSIEQELSRMHVPKEKITRIQAYSSINGTRGCALSHIKALDYAASQGFHRFLILEDDVVFLQSPEAVCGYIKRFAEFAEKNPWDLFFLGTHPKHIENTQDPRIKRVLVSYCAHAYCLEARYLPTLRASYVRSYEKLWELTSFEESFHYAIDRLWVNLQIEHQWFLGDEEIVRQGAFYSDIELRMRDREPKPIGKKNPLSKK
ncbi:MAG: glycosyltransferase family 25 protein [Chlamydiota bacterium]